MQLAKLNVGEAMAFSGSVEDKLAIRELVDIYADGVNQRSSKIWASTWAENSEWNLPVVPGMESVVGKENIVAAWEQAMSLFPFAFMLCSIGSIKVENRSVATMRSYTSEVVVTQDGTELRPQGVYTDSLKKIDGEWLFTQRVFSVLRGE